MDFVYRIITIKLDPMYPDAKTCSAVMTMNMLISTHQITELGVCFFFFFVFIFYPLLFLTHAQASPGPGVGMHNHTTKNANTPPFGGMKSPYLE